MKRSTRLRADPEKLRAWQRRRKPLARHTRLRPVNPERRRWKFRRNFHSDEFVEFTKSRRCWSCGRRGTKRNPIEAAHVLHDRGMGGCGGTHEDVAPQCRRCHRAWGQGREAFLRERRLTWEDAKRAVEQHQRAWQRHLAELERAA